jgi:hypothetical protein
VTIKNTRDHDHARVNDLPCVYDRPTRRLKLRAWSESRGAVRSSNYTTHLMRARV